VTSPFGARRRGEYFQLDATATADEQPNEQPSQQPADPNAPQMALVQVANGAGFTRAFVAPTHWLSRFHDGSETQFMLFGSLGPSLHFRTGLECEPNFYVECVARNSTDTQLFRELAIHRRISMMRGLGVEGLDSISPVLETCEIDELTFVLRALGDGDLGEAINRYRMPMFFQGQVPLELTLQVIADVLRGLAAFRELGIVHGKLGLQTIAVNKGRAYIFDFSAACLTHNGDPGLGCAAYAEPQGFASSAYIHAPEMRDGRPTGPENDMWAAGLLLGEMLLGYLPVVDAMGVNRFDDMTSLGRERIRQSVRTDFEVEQSRGFRKLCEGLQELLTGMLHKKPSQRMTPQEALAKLTAVAAELGVELQGAQEPLALPSGWWQAPSTDFRLPGLPPQQELPSVDAVSATDAWM